MRVGFVDLGTQFDSLRGPILAKFEEISSRGAYVLSEEVEVFEESFAKHCDARFAIGVGNGTDAIVLPLRALGVEPGDEVITAPNSFIATAGAIVQAGAIPVFADVADDFNLDVLRIEKAITPRTRAIIPVHLTGMPARMGEVLEIARRRDLVVVEDAAQAVGARYRGRAVGAIGNAGSFSLHPLKNLHVHGDGGVITTDDEGLRDRLVQLRNHGLKNRDECEFWGVNSRLDAIQAAIGSIKLTHLAEYTARMRAIAKRYAEGLEGLVTLPEEPPGMQGVFHNFILRTKARDDLKTFLLDREIETKVHYPIPLHLQQATTSFGYKPGDFPVAEAQAKTILSLPIYPELGDDKISYVVEQIRAYFKNGGMTL